MRSHYQVMNRYADLRRLAETRAGDLRDNGKNATLLGAIVAVSGTAATATAQLAFRDDDTARDVTTAVGIGVALVGGVLAAVASLTASTKEAGELDAAAATIDGALGEASTIEVELSRVSGLTEQIEETARLAAAFTKRASSARTVVVRNTRAGEVDRLETDTDRVSEEMFASLGAAEVPALSLSAFFAQVVRERSEGFQPAGEQVRGELEERASRVVEVQMQPGKCYRLIAAAQPAINGVNDIDLLLHDAQNQLLSEDRERNSRPVVDYCPAVAGTYFAQIQMYQGSGPFVFRTFGRDAPVPAPGPSSPQ